MARKLVSYLTSLVNDLVPLTMGAKSYQDISFQQYGALWFVLGLLGYFFLSFFFFSKIMHGRNTFIQYNNFRSKIVARLNYNLEFCFGIGHHSDLSVSLEHISAHAK